MMTLLIEKVGFLRADITKVYPVKSGFCINVSKNSLRETLARKVKRLGTQSNPG